MAVRAGYNGPVLGVSHACARCKHRETARMAQCAGNSIVQLDCARRTGVLTLNYCAMTLPVDGYKAQWAPNGTVLNTADPHICSPGPDNQLMNLMLHMVASYFRK